MKLIIGKSNFLCRKRNWCFYQHFLPRGLIWYDNCGSRSDLEAQYGSGSASGSWSVKVSDPSGSGSFRLLKSMIFFLRDSFTFLDVSAVFRMRTVPVRKFLVFTIRIRILLFFFFTSNEYCILIKNLTFTVCSFRGGFVAEIQSWNSILRIRICCW